MRRENKITAYFFTFFLVLVCASCNVEFLYRFEFLVFIHHRVKFLLVLQSLKFLFHLQLPVQKSPLIFNAQENFPVDKILFLIFFCYFLIFFFLVSFDQFFVINVIEALSNIAHFFRNILRINILIQPFTNVSLF